MPNMAGAIMHNVRATTTYAEALFARSTSATLPWALKSQQGPKNQMPYMRYRAVFCNI